MFDALKRGLQRAPLTPFILAGLIVLPRWQRNRFWLLYEDFLPSFLVLLGLFLLIFLACIVALRNQCRASILTGILIFFLFYSPSLAEQVTENDFGQLGIIAVFGLLCFGIWKQVPYEKERLERVNLLTNLALLILLTPSLILAIVQFTSLQSGRPDPASTFAPFSGSASEDSPDVWHIVMDRYPNRQVLSDIYGLDNEEFLESLRTRGFAVNDEAFANYQVTHQSLASTLNANYLDDFTARIANSKDPVPMFYAVRSNRAAQFFSDNGYEVVFAGTWANITNKSDNADRVVSYRNVSEISRILIDSSVPGKLGKQIGLPFADGRGDQCIREKGKFEELSKVATGSSRKYVFAHFLVPHPPYVFDENGECQTFAQAQQKSRNENFRAQVEYANQELIKLIDAILEGPRPATIILHSDEGPYPAEFAVDEKFHWVPQASQGAWREGGVDLWREKLSILMAVRHASGTTSKAPHSPVNLYSEILNRDFSGEMPILPERHYFYHDPDHIYDYTDVTDALR